jgi:hypothetical protein
MILYAYKSDAHALIWRTAKRNAFCTKSRRLILMDSLKLSGWTLRQLLMENFQLGSIFWFQIVFFYILTYRHDLTTPQLLTILSTLSKLINRWYPDNQLLRWHFRIFYGIKTILKIGKTNGEFLWLWIIQKCWRKSL